MKKTLLYVFLIIELFLLATTHTCKPKQPDWMGQYLKAKELNSKKDMR
jgi:hypothetical protein